MSKSEFAQFYDKIAEIKIEKDPQFRNAPDGSFIFDIENKLVYTDGDWENPTIQRVVTFDISDGTMLHDAKTFFTDFEREGANYEEIQGLLASVFGEKVVSIRYADVRGTTGWQDRGRARKDIGRTGRDNNADLSAEGKRKYALKKSVEQIEDLVAVHNTTANKLSKTLDLGGFPMPSIAITKTGIAHSNFGEITLVFGRETVDPKADKRNKVYSADAWTPTVPRTEYEADAKAEKRIRSRLNQIKSLIPADYRGYLSQYANLDDALNRYDGQAGLVQRAMTDSSMRAAYVADKGDDVTMEKKSVTEGGVSDEMADKYRRTLALAAMPLFHLQCHI